MIAPMIGMTISLDQRIDDRAERRADDHADGEIDDIAAHREFLEFLEHRALPSSSTVVPAQAPANRWIPADAQ